MDLLQYSLRKQTDKTYMILGRCKPYFFLFLIVSGLFGCDDPTSTSGSFDAGESTSTGEADMDSDTDTDVDADADADTISFDDTFVDETDLPQYHEDIENGLLAAGMFWTMHFVTPHNITLEIEVEIAELVSPAKGASNAFVTLRNEGDLKIMVGTQNAKRYYITDLDLAILADTGMPVVGTDAAKALCE